MFSTFPSKGPSDPQKMGEKLLFLSRPKCCIKLAYLFKTELHIPPPVVQKDVLRGVRGL